MAEGRTTASSASSELDLGASAEAPSPDGGAIAPEERQTPGRGRSGLSVLRHRNFALLLFGNGLSHTGDQMEWVARGWLVLELTDSPLALGMVALATGLPRLLLGLVAGALADRLDQRALLYVCAIASLAASTLFATLVLVELISYWQVLAIVLFSSVFSTLNLVTRQTMIPELVPRDELDSAIALHSTMRAITQIVAQSVAGLLIGVIGVAGVLYVNSASFLALLGALWLMRLTLAPAPTERLGFRHDIALGLRFIWSRSDLLALIVLALVPIAVVMPYRTLVPIFARDVWQVGPEGYGVLMAAPGLGGIVAATIVTFVGARHRGLLMLGSLMGLSVALTLFALAPTFAPAVAALVVVGAAFNVYRILNTTILQILTPREMMGRVMGLYHMDRGLMPLGGFLLGAAASVVGAPLAVAAAAVVCGALTLAAAWWRPSLRRL